MSLFSRKLGGQLSKISSSVLYPLLVNGTSPRHPIRKHHFGAFWGSFFIGSTFERPGRIAVQTKLLSGVAGTILVQARDPAQLALEIQNSLDERRLEDAWKFYEQHMVMDGFPRKSMVNRILATFAESLDAQWLERAFGLVQQACEEGKQNLLEKETLIYLSYALAKSGLPVPASTVLRKLVEMKHFPCVAAWSAILAHMSQEASGAYLAAELILEIGYLFQDNRVDPRRKSNASLIAMKPNTTSFKIALSGCLLFGTARKAEQLLDMMPRVGVKIDSDLLIVMAHVHERNGKREELRKLERHISEAYNVSEIQFREFQTCLLSCHLKLGDLDSASDMVLDMLHKAKVARSSLATSLHMIDSVIGKKKSSPILDSTPSIVHEQPQDSENNGSSSSAMVSYEEYLSDKKYTRLESEAKEIVVTMLPKLQTRVDLLTTQRGIIQPTEKTFVKLVKAFLEAGKTKDLAGFLIKAEREDTPFSNDDSILAHVIDSCISLGWLDRAHDLLDEMRMAGIKTIASLYSSLLRAYCQENRAGDAAALLRDARQLGIQLDSSSYQALIESKILQQNTHEALHLFKEMKEAKIPKAGHREFERLVKGCSEGGEAKLMAKLVEEIKDGEKVDCGVHDWNNVIHFFSRKRLMQDAQKALAKMLSLGYAPNAQTFHSMVTGYAAVGGNYLAVTELWGEMKSLASSAPLKFDQELLDSVLYTFVRGGFFGRANEVVDMLEEGKMFVDKYKYRTLFLKYHKNMCKGKAPKFQSESQFRRREEVLVFKNWVGLN